MDRTEKHLKNISEAIDGWLDPSNEDLKRAIDRTLSENLFSFEDIKFQIRHLKTSLTYQNLLKWADKRSGNLPLLLNRSILCLHAGNIPLVGLQDFLAVTISGLNYKGKLSRKDPWLLPTLIDKFDEYGITGERDYSTNLKDFSSSNVDAIIFAGSESGASDVVASLDQYGIADSSTPKLLRTAHFSIAYITDDDKKTMEDLTEAVFRYGGTGCRSVAIVIAPFHLNSQKCHFTDYVEAFWLRNPQLKKPDPNLFYRYATNKALGIEQAWLDHFLIEETTDKPDEKFILHWVKGDEKTLNQVVGQFKNGLQTIYTPSGRLPFDRADIPYVEIDKLENAQKPDIWWKPDGIDTIQWITENVS